MSIITILIVVNVFSALAIVVLALMQTSKGDMGSAFGGGGSQSMFGSRGSANFLSRSTSLMVTVFFITSLALAYIYSQRDQSTSVVDSGSVLDQVPEQIESDVPTIDGQELIPADAFESDVPTLDDLEVPTIDADEVEALIENNATDLENAQ
ncbi:MAG: preprotein translocase subunit SecG [Pseudomonadota bacterium]